MTTEEKIRLFNERINEIEREEAEHILKLQKLVQPIAHSVKKILRRRGIEKGRFRNKRTEYRVKGFEFTQERSPVLGSLGDICVYYNMGLVMMFDPWFPMISDFKDKRNKHLYYFKEGPWMEELIVLYNEVMLANLKENFNIAEVKAE